MKPNFESVLPNYGFDKTINPAWFMVPFAERKPILLFDAEGATVSSRSPTIATIAVVEKQKGVPKNDEAYSPTARIDAASNAVALAVKGNAPGRAILEVKRNDRIEALLEVSVRQPVTLKLAFNFVADKFSRTKREEKQIDEIIKILNDIYNDQTNVKFVNNKVSQLKFDKDFKAAVNYRADNFGRALPGHDWDTVVAKRDKNSHINIYFVWRIENGAANDNVWGLNLHRDCFIDDARETAEEAAQTIAHEIGHALGIDDLTKTRRHRNPDTHRFERVLVNADNYALGYGLFIPRHQSRIMWAIAKQIAR